MKLVNNAILSFAKSLQISYPNWDQSTINTISELMQQTLSGDLYVTITDLTLVNHIRDKFPFVVETVNSENRVYLQKSYSEKVKFENQFKSFLDYKTTHRQTDNLNGGNLSALIETLEKEAKVSLAEEQKKTISDVIQSNFRIISGGPGTGKTTVVSFILKSLERLKLLPENERVALVAPTGRASQRLTESIQKNLEKFPNHQTDVKKFRGQTIHHLLKINPTNNQSKYGEKRYLPYDLIIIDETSMVDLKLMNLFFSAIHFDTQIILLGDPNQLPSVGQGEVLTDLIFTLKKKKDFLSELTKNHRFSDQSEFSIFAEAVKTSFDQDEKTINFPKPTLISKSDWKSEKDFVWLQGDRTNKKDDKGQNQILDFEQDSLVEFLWDELFLPTAMYTSKLNWNSEDLKVPLNKVKFETLINDYRCLTILRNGYFGIESIQNRILQFAKKYITNNSNQTHLTYKHLSKSFYFEGMPIIIKTNDQIRKLFNGDIGLVVKINNELRAVFPIEEKLYSFALDTLPDHEPAFFLTIHKSQGSEYKSIFLYLPPIVSFDSSEENTNSLLNRRILYTAITRAKEKVILLGDTNTWEFGLSSFRRRYTGIQIS
ncbi:exodeoxyribonuclease V subunit alpha (plasmid) [Leptospira sp. WS39.C2]